MYTGKRPYSHLKSMGRKRGWSSHVTWGQVVLKRLVSVGNSTFYLLSCEFIQEKPYPAVLSTSFSSLTVPRVTWGHPQYPPPVWNMFLRVARIFPLICTSIFLTPFLSPALSLFLNLSFFQERDLSLQYTPSVGYIFHLPSPVHQSPYGHMQYGFSNNESEDWRWRRT